jgi:hypothetical protein
MTPVRVLFQIFQGNKAHKRPWESHDPIGVGIGIGIGFDSWIDGDTDSDTDSDTDPDGNGTL